MFVLQILLFFLAFILISLFNHIISTQRKAREAARQLEQEQSEVQEEEPLDDDPEYEEPDMEDEPPAEPHHGYGYEHVRAEVPPHGYRYEYVRPEVPVQVPPQRELVEGPPRIGLVLPPSVPRELLLPDEFRSPWVNPNPAYARRRFDNSRRLMFQPQTPQNPLRGPFEDT